MEVLITGFLENLFIGKLNVTLDHSQYKVEDCALSTCPSGFAVWVCAEDFNPDWWAKYVASTNKGTKTTNWLILLSLITYGVVVFFQVSK